MAILETIQYRAIRTINVKKQFLKEFNCVQFALLVLDSNTWHILAVC